MKITTLTDRAMKTASEIYFNERKLKDIAYISNYNWTKREITDQEEFDKELKLNKQLYKKLRKYRDELFYKVTIDKEITKEDNNLINNKIDALLDGTYKEKYC